MRLPDGRSAGLPCDQDTALREAVDTFLESFAADPPRRPVDSAFLREVQTGFKRIDITYLSPFGPAL